MTHGADTSHHALRTVDLSGRREVGPDLLPARAAGRTGHPAAGDLSQAAACLDDALMTRVVARSIQSDGVVAVWEQLVCPALRTAGHRPADADRVLAEILLTRASSAALATVRQPRPAGGPAVLLACADDEPHTLALEALAAALAEAGTASCLLGARVAPRALADATARLRPTVVVVWSQTRNTADPVALAPLTAARRRPAIIAAGPGWPIVMPAVAALRPASLAEATEMTLASLT